MVAEAGLADALIIRTDMGAHVLTRMEKRERLHAGGGPVDIIEESVVANGNPTNCEAEALRSISIDGVILRKGLQFVDCFEKPLSNAFAA